MKCCNCQHKIIGSLHFDHRSMSYHEQCNLANKQIGIPTHLLQDANAPDWCPIKKGEIQVEEVPKENISACQPTAAIINNFFKEGFIPMNSTAKNTVTAEEIDALMKDAEISISTTHEKCTVVSVKLKNGFVLTESSACVDKANYDVEMGTKICLQRIKDKLWAFEGYVLQKALYAAKQAAEDAKKLTAKERVQQELSELEERLCKLKHGTDGIAFNEAESRLLYEQSQAMEEYIRILRARLSIWRDKL